MKSKWIVLIALIALIAVSAAYAASKPDAINIAARPAVVTYGFTTKLLGAVAPPQSTSVTVAGKTCLGAPTGAELASPLTVSTDTLGHWSVRVMPRVRMLYQATSGDAASKLLSVQVRPRVKLARLGGHRFRATFWAAESFAGKKAFFQRYTSHGWKTLKTVRLRQTGANGPTIIAGAIFRSGIARHQKVRMLITRNQVGNCYLPGWSSFIRT